LYSILLKINGVNTKHNYLRWLCYIVVLLDGVYRNLISQKQNPASFKKWGLGLEHTPSGIYMLVIFFWGR
jgi:hypothetical protein